MHAAGGPTLGLLLRKAREARGMSIDDVVGALKLSVRQVEAIETDRMDLLPGAVFQRGFVKSYARLLKLDPVPLLGLINQATSAQEPEIRPPANMGNAGPRGGLRNIPVLVLLSAGLLILAAAVTLWHYMGGTLPMLPVISGISAPAPIPVEQSGVTAAVPVQPEEVVQPQITTPPPTEMQPAANAGAAPNVAASGRVLSFDFRGESWVEVKDAAGAIVLSGIFSSGTQAATGRPPFEIVLGNAPVVGLRDGDKLVDLKPFTRAEVARLTLE